MSDSFEFPERREPVDPALVGIGGWLVLPALGLILGPIVSVVLLVMAMLEYPAVQAAGFGGLFALELVVDAALIIFMLYAATRFFGKRSDAPAVMIALYVAVPVVLAIMLAVESSQDATLFAEQSVQQLVRSIFTALIWVPYFCVSKRVKATFVN